MARHANYNWNLPDGTPNTDGSRSHGWDSIQTAVLMDIRDELQKLNRLLGCQNFVEIPAILRTIRDNTTKPKRARKAKAKAVR